MKTRLTAITLVVFMTMAANASDAGQLAGGPIYATGQDYIDCEYVNFGSTNVTPKSQELFSSNSTTPLVSSSACPNGTAVTPNQSCLISYTGAPIADISCKVTFSESAADVRGALQLLNSGGDSLATVELR